MGREGIHGVPSENLRHLHRWLPRILRADGVLRDAWHERQVDRHPVRPVHAGRLRLHRRAVAHDGGRCLLRRRAQRPAGVQRHGDGGRLDVGRILRRDGRRHLHVRPPLHGLHRGLDRRLHPDRDADGAVPAQVRLLHGAGLHRHALRRQADALLRDRGAGGRVVHLRDGPDHRHRDDRGARLPDPVRGRRLARPVRHPRVLDARRHARGDLDPGRAVHRADRRLPDPDLLDVDRAGFRLAAAPGVRRRRAAHHGTRADHRRRHRAHRDSGGLSRRSPPCMRRRRRALSRRGSS